jgi:hypothetical protein
MTEAQREDGDWRPRVAELIDRLRTDSDYRSRIEADPLGELERIGIPRHVRDDIERGISTHRPCSITCTKGTSECTRSAYT